MHTQAWQSSTHAISTKKQNTLPSHATKTVHKNAFVLQNCTIEKRNGETRTTAGALIGDNVHTQYVAFGLPIKTCRPLLL